MTGAIHGSWKGAIVPLVQPSGRRPQPGLQAACTHMALRPAGTHSPQHSQAPATPPAPGGRRRPRTWRSPPTPPPATWGGTRDSVQRGRGAQQGAVQRHQGNQRNARPRARGAHVPQKSITPQAVQLAWGSTVVGPCSAAPTPPPGRTRGQRPPAAPPGLVLRRAAGAAGRRARTGPRRGRLGGAEGKA